MEYFDDIFHDMELFQRDFMGRMRKEIEAINKAVSSGDLKGHWDVKEINEPNMKGYVAYGQFYSDSLPEQVSPFESFPRPIRPTRPILPKPSLDEVREPLIDVFEDKKAVKVCIELPGVEKDDIQLNISEGQAEIKAKKFFKTLKLPKADVDSEKINATYKNGILEMTIPKKKAAEQVKRKRITIE